MLYDQEKEILQRSTEVLLQMGESMQRSMQQYQSQVADDIRLLQEHFYGMKDVEDVQHIAAMVEDYFICFVPEAYKRSPLASLIHLIRLGFRLNQLPNLISLEEAAMLAGKSSSGIYKDARAGKVRHAQLYGMYFVDRHDIKQR